MENNNPDVFGSSTAPLTWHDFLERMRHPSASDFVKSIKSFIVSLSNNPHDPEKDSAAVQEFLAKMEGAFRAHSLWAGSSEEELESAGEALQTISNDEDLRVHEATLHDWIDTLIAIVLDMPRYRDFFPETLTPTRAYEPHSEVSFWKSQGRTTQNLRLWRALFDWDLGEIEDSLWISNLITLRMEAANGDGDEIRRAFTPGLEKYVMTKLFNRVFASLPEDVECDEKLSEKMALIQQFIRPENLDIQPAFQNESSWLLAQKELQKINMCKAPRDKLVCILNCCKVINNLLLNASIASNEHPPGADEFLPVLIYVTIKANPPQLHSNLLYIQRYRCQSRLVSEAAYFFTNMLSAESFISTIDAKSISMNESEFQDNMESARALLSGLTTLSEADQDHYSSKHKSQESITKKPSISDLEKNGAREVLKEEEEEEVRKVFRGYRFLYSEVGDLSVNDVEELLSSYKQLVFKYVCLSRGMNVDPTALSEGQIEDVNRNEEGESSESVAAHQPQE